MLPVLGNEVLSNCVVFYFLLFYHLRSDIKNNKHVQSSLNHEANLFAGQLLAATENPLPAQIYLSSLSLLYVAPSIINKVHGLYLSVINR